MSGVPPVPGGNDPLDQFKRLVAGDLRILALVQDKEMDAGLLSELRGSSCDDLLGLRLNAQAGRDAVELLCQGIDDIPAETDSAAFDILASEYADIYLTHGLNASPCESVWLDEDGLAMQEPMFQIRDWYARHGLEVENWRMRTDDHLVNQLQFVAHLLDKAKKMPADLAEPARFMDEHLLRWVGEFAERVGARCRTRFYAGVAGLTAAYLDELRDLLSEITGEPRPSAAEIKERMKKPLPAVAVAAPSPFVPGQSPSW